MSSEGLAEPTASRPTFQEGVDLLWNFQLRKEHAVLLEKANTTTKELEQLAAETKENKKNFEERVASLEAIILSLQKEERKDRQAFEKYAESMAALKSQMGDVMAILEVHEQRLEERRNNGTSSYSKEDEHISHPFNSSLRSPSTTTSLIVTHQHAASSSRTSKHIPEPMQAQPNVSSHTIDLIPITSPKFAGPMTCNKSRSRNGSQSIEVPSSKQPQAQESAPSSRPIAPIPRLAKISTPTSQPAKLPRLNQGTGTLKNYLKSTNTIFQSLPSPKDQRFEIEFIATFINGVREPDQKQALVEELQQQYQSRTKKDGKVEILCAWKEVGEVMKSSGLLIPPDVGPGSKNKSLKSKFEKELQGLLQT